MLTRRGFFFLAVAIATFGVSVTHNQALPTVVALTVLIWFAAAAAIFSVRILLALPTMSARRLIDGQPPGRAVLWCGRHAEVRVDVTTRSWLGVERAHAAELAPSVGDIEGSLVSQGPCSRNRPLPIHYRLGVPVVGRAHFDGVVVQIGDAHGFFRHRVVLRADQDLLVLPALAQGRNWRGGIKRFNLLPAQGAHRLHHAGTGTELLDLRDYIPGDPPRSIAWKVSARRDRLITKVYESEVPVRCSLFLDVSRSVRVGAPGRTPLVQLIELAAGVAQQLSALRDPVGLYLVDGHGCEVLRPAVGNRHLLRVYGQLGRAAARADKSTVTSPEPFIEPALGLARRVWPELMSPRRNKPGVWFADLPRTTLPWYVYTPIMAIGAGVVLANLRSNRIAVLQSGAVLAAIVLMFLGSLGMLVRIVRRRDRWQWRRGSRRRRKQLAAVIAAQHRLGPGAIPLLTHGSQALAHWLQGWLAHHDVRIPEPLYDENGKYLFADPDKIDVLCKWLLRAVTHGRDDELFVLLIEPWELEDQWPRLLETLKVALARHHHAMLVCPWPAGLPLPGSREWSEEEPKTVGRLDPRFGEPDAALRQHDRVRYRQAYERLKASIGKLGVPLICAAVSDSVQLILDRIEQIRAARIRR